MNISETGVFGEARIEINFGISLHFPPPKREWWKNINTEGFSKEVIGVGELVSLYDEWKEGDYEEMEKLMERLYKALGTELVYDYKKHSYVNGIIFVQLNKYRASFTPRLGKEGSVWLMERLRNFSPFGVMVGKEERNFQKVVEEVLTGTGAEISVSEIEPFARGRLMSGILSSWGRGILRKALIEMAKEGVEGNLIEALGKKVYEVMSSGTTDEAIGAILASVSMIFWKRNQIEMPSSRIGGGVKVVAIPLVLESNHSVISLNVLDEGEGEVQGFSVILPINDPRKEHDKRNYSYKSPRYTGITVKDAKGSYRSWAIKIKEEDRHGIELEVSVVLEVEGIFDAKEVDFIPLWVRGNGERIDFSIKIGSSKNRDRQFNLDLITKLAMMEGKNVSPYYKALIRLLQNEWGTNPSGIRVVSRPMKLLVLEGDEICLEGRALEIFPGLKKGRSVKFLVTGGEPKEEDIGQDEAMVKLAEVLGIKIGVIEGKKDRAYHVKWTLEKRILAMLAEANFWSLLMKYPGGEDMIAFGKIEVTEG